MFGLSIKEKATSFYDNWAWPLMANLLKSWNYRAGKKWLPINMWSDDYIIGFYFTLLNDLHEIARVGDIRKVDWDNPHPKRKEIIEYLFENAICPNSTINPDTGQKMPHKYVMQVIQATNPLDFPEGFNMEKFREGSENAITYLSLIYKTTTKNFMESNVVLKGIFESLEETSLIDDNKWDTASILYIDHIFIYYIEKNISDLEKIPPYRDPD
tara:strand:- start:523 stop:1161 length:639 start_codon:yes stop_codon:yes gene_type:complete